jgi:hypothetical protein
MLQNARWAGLQRVHVHQVKLVGFSIIPSRNTSQFALMKGTPSVPALDKGGASLEFHNQQSHTTLA